MNALELTAKIEALTVNQVLVNPLDNPFALETDLVPVSEAELDLAKSSLIQLIKNSDGLKYGYQTELERIVFGSKQLRQLSDVELEILRAVQD